MKVSPSRGDHFVVLGKYDEEFVERFKAEVPADKREWRPGAKCWRVWPPYDQTARDIIAELEAERNA